MSSSTTEYKKVVGGKLSFKGSSKPVTSKSSSKTDSQSKKRKLGEDDSKQSKDEGVADEIVVLNGTGRITSSGTTVHGHNAEFMNQLKHGDAIIITHPTTLQEETKIVRMVLSNVSIGISSVFSTDLISTTPFRYIRAPRDVEDEEAKEKKLTEKKHKAEEDAFGTYASQGGSKFTYRVRKDGAFGGYKIMTEDLSNTTSREDLLNMRSKKKADRLC